MTATTETGYIIKKDGTVVTVPGTEGGFDFASSLFATSTAFAHNHNEGHLSIFSNEDMWTLFTAIDEGNVDNPKSFAYGLTTHQGPQYVLVIDNVQKFKSWGTPIFKGSETIRNFWLNAYNNTIKITNTVAENEKQFLAKITTTDGTGLKLLKFVNGELHEVKANSSGTATTTPCPN